jgi:two-component system chemotaxis sensor kinase CheA
MDLKDEGFFKELLNIFKMETAEHIVSMLQGVEGLAEHQNTDRQLEIGEAVHRAAHSLKGAARTIGLADVEPICQSLETSFGLLKRQKVSLPQDLLDLLTRTIRNLETLLGTLGPEGKVAGDKTELIRQIEDIQSKMSAVAR